MFENLFLNLRGMFRAAAQGAALVTTIMLFGDALSLARSPAPSAGKRPAVLDLSIERCWKETRAEASHLRFRHNKPSHHVWIARFASVELRLEWASDDGLESWSATIQDLHGKQVARAAAAAETGKCI